MNRHVSEFDLALHSGGDLPRWKAYFVARHLRRCAACAQAAAEFTDSRSALAALGEMEIAAPAWLEERIIARAEESTQPHPALAPDPAQAPGLGRAASPAPSFARRPARLAWSAALVVAVAVAGVVIVKWPHRATNEARPAVAVTVPPGSGGILPAGPAAKPAETVAKNVAPEVVAPPRAATERTPPVAVPAVQAHATRTMLIGEARNANRRERLVLYTSGPGGLSEVSATGTGVNVTQADPATGAVRITRLIMEDSQEDK